MKIPSFVAGLLRKWAEGIIASRTYDFSIGDPENPVWRRWFVFPRNTFGNIYIHHWLRNDDDRALHDHPWHSLAIHVGGQMVDVYAPSGTNPADKANHMRRLIRVGDITLRGPLAAHRVEMMHGKPSISVFCRGPDLRNWGFWCPKGWRPWQEYASNTSATSRIGVGCGE